MSDFAKVRLATYGAAVAIFVMGQNRVSIIPLTLSDPDMRDAAVEAESRLRERLDEVERIARSAGFFATKRSGAELLTIAKSAAAGYGASLSEFHHPLVKMTVEDGRVVWSLYFSRNYGANFSVAPAEAFSVIIEDETGAATVRDETATM